MNWHAISGYVRNPLRVVRADLQVRSRPRAADSFDLLYLTPAAGNRRATGYSATRMVANAGRYFDYNLRLKRRLWWPHHLRLVAQMERRGSG